MTGGHLYLSCCFINSTFRKNNTLFAQICQDYAKRKPPLRTLRPGFTRAVVKTSLKSSISTGESSQENHKKVLPALPVKRKRKPPARLPNTARTAADKSRIQRTVQAGLRSNRWGSGQDYAGSRQNCRTYWTLGARCRWIVGAQIYEPHAV